MTSVDKMNLKVVVAGYYAKLLQECDLKEDTMTEDIKTDLKIMFQVGKIAARLEQGIYKAEDLLIIDTWREEIVNMKVGQ